MAFIQYLTINGTEVPAPDDYSVEMEDIESDSSGETEAGTTQRDIVREGVVTIPVSFSVSAAWLKKLTAFKQEASLAVKYLDPETGNLKETEMFIEGFKAKLVKDTSYGGLWSVSFNLKEF